MTVDLHVDCPTGLAGDMLLAGLIDLGVPLDVIESPLAALGLSGRFRLEVLEARSGGLRGRRVAVQSLEPDPPHRHWAEIRDLIQNASLDPDLQTQVLKAFSALADAEAAVHGCEADAVHFHEVGAIDALVDVVGVCAAVRHLQPDVVSCTPPPTGHGSVRTAHGVLPVPAPAVLELARRHAVPLKHSEGFPPGELTTPTGLALMATLAERFTPPSLFVPVAVGVGLGHRQLDRPNLLRISRLQVDADVSSGLRWQPLVVQEAWIDDASPEDLAWLLTRLRDGGAVDAAVAPLQMKKGRAAHAVTALVSPEQADSLRQVWLTTGSSLGLRERQQGRWVLPRRSGTLTTDWGPLRAKQMRRPDGRCSVKPEADDLQRLSRTSGRSIEELRLAAASVPFESEEPWDW